MSRNQRSRRTPTRRLRAAIEAMPLATRKAMLEGIADNEIIVGAYVDNKTGGICPMLAAHRCGGRTNFDTFATAWDQFTGGGYKNIRSATRREIRALRGYLEQSLIGPELSDEPLAGAVREVQASRRRLAEAEAQEAAGLSVEQMLAEVLDEDLGGGHPEPLVGPHEDELGNQAVGRSSQQ